jgi:hypothetical protein
MVDTVEDKVIDLSLASLTVFRETENGTRPRLMRDISEYRNERSCYDDQLEVGSGLSAHSAVLQRSARLPGLLPMLVGNGDQSGQ